MDYAKELENTREAFERALKKTAEEWDFPAPLAQSMQYSLFTGGKRFRPVLFIETYKAFRGCVDASAMLFAQAVEVLHTYSLVHDDLPCMDNDDFRRGQLTSHKKFGEHIAVLTGDALLNMAFELALKAAECGLDKNCALKACKRFAELTGASGLIAGQVADLSFSGRQADFKELEYIYAHKTCDLIAAAVECAAILAGADDGAIAALKSYAYNFGFAFQLADDIIDGNDCDGCSVLKIMPMSDARALLVDYTLRAVSSLQSVNADTGFLAYFAEKAEKRLK